MAQEFAQKFSQGLDEWLHRGSNWVALVGVLITVGCAEHLSFLMHIEGLHWQFLLFAVGIVMIVRGSDLRPLRKRIDELETKVAELTSARA
jgi:hypothetical protein